VSNARNYRYLLEALLSAPSRDKIPVTREIVMEILAEIDWLFVLYTASDVLHNDIDPAGVEIDHNFIPDVFYSSDRDEAEAMFGREMANATLGVGLDEDDEVKTSPDDETLSKQLDEAFSICCMLFKCLHVGKLPTETHR
jgi:hypothetical protein